MPPPPGFGTEGAATAVKVTDADLRDANERFQRYDENKDGFLDKNEISRGRWNEDVLAFDQNRDGRLTPAELAARYAPASGHHDHSRCPAVGHAHTGGSYADTPRVHRADPGDRSPDGRVRTQHFRPV